MREKKKILSPYKRKIHIDGLEWTYQIRKDYLCSIGHVKVCSPDRKKKWSLEIGELSSWECSGYYDDYVKNNDNAMTPAHVKRLIEKRILGRKIAR